MAAKRGFLARVAITIHAEIEYHVSNRDKGDKSDKSDKGEAASVNWHCDARLKESRPVS